MPLLLTTKEAQELLRRRTPEATIALLEELCVKPVPLGQGRGRGYLWYEQEILEALDKRRGGRKAKSSASGQPIAWNTGSVLEAVYGHQKAQ
jgi:hypothetical protein